jgi:hypothetical protein
MRNYSTTDILFSREKSFFLVPKPYYQGPLSQSHKGDNGQNATVSILISKAKKFLNKKDSLNLSYM